MRSAPMRGDHIQAVNRGHLDVQEHQVRRAGCGSPSPPRRRRRIRPAALSPDRRAAGARSRGARSARRRRPAREMLMRRSRSGMSSSGPRSRGTAGGCGRPRPSGQIMSRRIFAASPYSSLSRSRVLDRPMPCRSSRLPFAPACCCGCVHRCTACRLRAGCRSRRSRRRRAGRCRGGSRSRRWAAGSGWAPRSPACPARRRSAWSAGP